MLLLLTHMCVKRILFLGKSDGKYYQIIFLMKIEKEYIIEHMIYLNEACGL